MELYSDPWRRQWQPTPVLLPGKSMDGGAWQAAVHGVAKSRTRLSDFTFTFMHWRRKWQPTPVFLPGESQVQGSLVGCRLWGRTESDMTEVTQHTLIPAPLQTGSHDCTKAVLLVGGWTVLHQEAKRDLPGTMFLFITMGDARCRSTLEEISQYTSDHCTHEISQKWQILELPRIYLPPSEYRCITKFCSIPATSCLSCPISTTSLL